ncbi:MAG TPA: hypothetical protein VF881_08295 [Polyangiaceae bacterium]
MCKRSMGSSWVSRVALALALIVTAPSLRAETITLQEGTTIKITRDAVLNGVTVVKGTELRIASVKKDESGAIKSVDLQQVDNEKRLFKSIEPAAVAALAASSTSLGGSAADRASIFKVAAQIPIVRDLSLGGVVFTRGTVLQIDRLVKDKDGRVVKIDLRETSGQKRLMRNVTIEQVLLALSPDDVTWPDGAVGRVIQLGAEFKYGGVAFPKGTRFVVTRVENDPKKNEVVKVDLRETEGDKRELASVPVAILKQNGALGTSVGAPK